MNWSSHPTPPHDPPDMSLIDVVAQTDSGAWCYLSLDSQAPFRCSAAFRLLWYASNLSHDQVESASRSGLAQSLVCFGIDSKQFLELVANASRENSQSPILLVRNDERQLHLTIFPVTSAGLVIGHLVRMKDVLESNIIDAVLDEIENARKRLQVLSDREQEILSLVFAGRTNKAVSITTGISEKTVEKHRARIMSKLSLQSTADLIRLVSRACLIDDLQAAVAKHPGSQIYAPGLYPPNRKRESA